MEEKTTGYKTRKEIAAELNISYKTLNRIITSASLDIPPRTLISPGDYKKLMDFIHRRNGTT